MVKLRIHFGSRVRVRRSSVFEFGTVLLDYLYPLMFGVAVGWLCAVFVGFGIVSKSSELQASKIASNLTTSQEKEQPDDGLSDFIFANPFSITPIPAIVEKTGTEEEEIVVTGSLASAVLMGTFPSFGAWIEDKDKLKKIIFLSMGESFDSYKLSSVLYDRAIFVGEDGNAVTKFLYLLPDTAVENKPKPQTPRARNDSPAEIAGQITAAEPGGKEGVVARDVVNRLLMNPFDEMSKFRLRPKFEGQESIGIEVEWIQDDSILGSLGVTENDVVKSVNGIPIKNMGDVVNAINSLMNGTRFDVEVLRGNSPTMLTYVVK